MRVGVKTTAQRGAALLLAMLTVALVAAISAAAYWQQWRAWGVEQAERQRAQSGWMLVGALDWSRLILRQDARASRVDHLAEPWAVPLQEARISSFLAADGQAPADSLLEAFLAGSMQDLQGRINLRNLVTVNQGKTDISVADFDTCSRLFTALSLPQQELQRFAQTLLRTLTPAAASAAAQPAPAAAADDAPLLPQRWGQLRWLGLSARSLDVLAPHATWLPERTPLNVNTASALALSASLPALDAAQAQALVAERERSHFGSLNDFRRTLTAAAAADVAEARFATTSRYFLVQGSLRLDDWRVQETSLAVRNGIDVRTVWRERGAGAPPTPSGMAPGTHNR